MYLTPPSHQERHNKRSLLRPRLRHQRLPILSLISSIRTYLQPAITDTTHTATSPAYNPSSKNINHASFVRKILQNIASGTPILPGLPQPGFRLVTSPVIACMLDPPLTSPLPISQAQDPGCKRSRVETAQGSLAATTTPINPSASSSAAQTS